MPQPAGQQLDEIRNRRAQLRQGDRAEDPPRVVPERTGDILLGGIGPPQGGGHRQEDVRGAAERQHQCRSPEAGEGVHRRQPGERRDVGGHRERQRGEHGERAGGRQVGAGHQIGSGDAEHHAGQGDHDCQAHAPGGEHPHAGGEQFVRDPAGARLPRAHDEVRQGQQGDGHGERRGGEQDRPGRPPAHRPPPRRSGGRRRGRPPHRQDRAGQGVSPVSLSSATLASRVSRSLRSMSGTFRSASAGTYAGAGAPLTTGYSKVCSAKYVCASAPSR